MPRVFRRPPAREDGGSVCHDGSLRALIAARERLGLPVSEEARKAARKDDQQGRPVPPPREERL